MLGGGGIRPPPKKTENYQKSPGRLGLTEFWGMKIRRNQKDYEKTRFSVKIRHFDDVITAHVT